ncbi:hypothetical protein [Sneathiella aquimaris]|uniref:hypothetical protein n=1 Tax=Sneathiella aquimaris TaxID=2599305 RepID=UPI001CA4978D|nr:hypothetical protein [Sneathiella aquimaris]
MSDVDKLEGIMKRHAKIRKAPYRDMLSFFDYGHLPTSLQQFSKPFHTLAHSLVDALPDHPQKMIALQRLLEAKDASVRIAVASSIENREQTKLKIAKGYGSGQSAEEIYAGLKKDNPDTKLKLEQVEEYILLLQGEAEA